MSSNPLHLENDCAFGQLALFGGKPAIHDPHLSAFHWPIFTDEEKQAVQEMLGRSASWEYYTDMGILEKDLCDYFGSKHALSMTNGTAALHSGLYGAGIGEGDEVITISYTYWATVLSMRLVGAIPVFADVLEATGGIDPEDVERKITSKTKGIMLVHLWGMPCEMDAIMKIAEKYNLKVIEDCSHAHGAEYKGRKVGTFGAAGCFSMQGSKNMPTIEGGFMLTDDAEVYARACALGHYNRVPKGHPLSAYNATGLGYKYRIHPVAASLGIHRIKTLDERNTRVTKRLQRLFDGLEHLEGLEFFGCPSHIKRAFYQAEAIYDEKVTGVPMTRMLKALNAEGAHVAHERYPLQHREAIYRAPEFWKQLPNVPDSLPVSERLHDMVLQLPTFPECDEVLIDRYIEAFCKVWHHMDKLKSPVAA